MAELQPLTLVLTQLAVIAAVALPLAAVARVFGRPGWVGGVIAGVLLSSAVLGRIAPGAFDALFVGGAALQARVADTRAEIARTQADLESFGVTPEAIPLELEAPRQRLAELEDQLQALQDRRRQQWLWLTLALVTLGAAAAGWRSAGLFQGASINEAMPIAVAALVVVAVAATLGAMLAGRMMPGESGTLWFAGLLAGCVSAPVLMPRAIAGPLVAGRSDLEREDLLRLGGSSSGLMLLIGWLTLMLMASDAAGADPAIWPTLVRGLGLLLIGLLGLVIAPPLLSRSVRRGGRIVPALAAALAVALVAVGHGWGGLMLPMLGWFVGGMFAPRRLLPTPRDDDPATGGGLAAMLGVVAAAAVAMHSDIIAGFDLVLVIVVLLSFGDAKAIGVMLGVRWFAGRRWIDGLRLGAAAGAGGVMPLALAWSAYHVGFVGVELLTALTLASLAGGLIAPTLLRLMPQVEQAQT